ncbi:uncharacterized protein BJ171DRAFT_501934 [Polychytrium aggregatum]|uniref:uncharacterized protein n=1 Tax=Polychytrium aggregatum TaxID=110093 RepID=UPI0022FEEF51|nr:uncharacterized protein BJ171DRAFT_501934 [Polychytrium aggregatum]KAI9205380.1 hypothetical protein BJ171DRAFT_501934 [Polychytrium aggregatum]
MTDNQDVLQFLEDLDASGHPSPSVQLPSSAASGSKDDVLSFLDEIANSSLPSVSPVPAAASSTEPSPSTKAAPTPVSATAASRPAAANTGAKQQSSSANTSASTNANANVSTGNAWNWSSIWSNAQQQASLVGSATVSSLSKGLETARIIADETTKAVVTNEAVKDLFSEGNKISDDLSKFTLSSVNNLVDTLAPPIQRASKVPTALPLYASTITIWFCFESFDDDRDLDMLHDFLQSTVNEMWLGGSGVDHVDTTSPLCEKVVVNSVKDPEPKIAEGIEAAMSNGEHILGRLLKLAGTSKPEAGNQPVVSPEQQVSDAPAPSTAAPQTLYVILQPFTTQIVSPLLPDSPRIQLQYLVIALTTSPDGNNSNGEVYTLTSQSVCKSGVEVDDDGKVVNGGGKLDKWSLHQRTRVLENLLTDLCEEFRYRNQVLPSTVHKTEAA